MGLWDTIKNGVKKAANAVGDFVNDVGDAVGDAVEAVGDAVNDGLNWLGEKLGITAITSWIGGIFKGIFSFIGAVIKGIFGIFAGMLQGIIKIVGGLFTGQWSLMLDGILDIGSSIIGTIVVVVGKFIALVQSIFYLQAFERRLTKNEETALRRVFKDTLNYYVIRIIEGHSGLFGLNDRPFTLGNTLYMKTNSFPVDLLIHETTHVWQYQQLGPRYTSDAVGAQWFIDDPYNWEKEINERNKQHWADFNKEAQAQFFQDLWIHGELVNPSGTTTSSGNGSFFDADDDTQIGYFEMNRTDYTDIANEAVKVVRNEWF